MEEQLVAVLCETDALSSFLYYLDGHAFAFFVPAGKVEGEAGGILPEHDRDSGLAPDDVIAVADLDGEVVVPDVDGGVIGLGVCGVGAEDE